MARAFTMCVIIGIVVLSAAVSRAQTGETGQYGEGSGVVTLEMYRQRQIDTQLEMQREQIEIQRQQLENLRQQLENQRQQLEMERQRIEIEREKLRMEREKKQTE